MPRGSSHGQGGVESLHVLSKGVSLARNHSAKPVVVLGFGAAGMSAVAALREAGYKGGITVVTDTDSMPYSPVLTSYYAAGRIDRDQCFIWGDANPASMADEVRVRSKVVAMNAEAHEVTLDDGCRVGYSKLVVATGAHPVVRGFPRTDGYSPFVLRTMEDAERLRQALSSPCCKKVLVSGTSMVGLKALEACLDRGIQVTLLGRSPHIMRSSAHPLAAARFEELIKNDTPDLTNLNKLIESERKKVKSPFNKNKRGITFFLTVALIACLFLLIASISFASATLLVISLISIAVFIAIYFLAVPRGK